MILEILTILFLVLALPGVTPNPPWAGWPSYLFMWLGVVCIAIRVFHPSFA